MAKIWRNATIPPLGMRVTIKYALQWLWVKFSISEYHAVSAACYSFRWTWISSNGANITLLSSSCCLLFFQMNLDFHKWSQHNFMLSSSFIWSWISSNGANVTLFVNRSNIQIIANIVFYEHTKHIKVDCRLICDVYDDFSTLV